MKTPIPSLNSATDGLDYVGQLRQFQAAADNERALLLTGWLLDQCQISADVFSAIVDALLWATVDPRTWVPKVEQAYQGLSRRQKKSTRSLMLFFYGHAGLHEQTISFAPRRFRNLVDLAFVMRANVQLGNLDQAERLVPKCLTGIQRTEFPEVKLWLTECLEDFYSKTCSEIPRVDAFKQSWRSNAH